MTRSKLAMLIAQQEGFFIPGSIPAKRLNPGDLRHAPSASHEGIGPDAIGIMPTAEAGWAALERQLHLFAQRGFTLEQCIETWAPPVENDTDAYLRFVCHGLNLSPRTPVSEALEISA